MTMYQCLIAVPTTPPTWGTFLNSALLLVVGAIITFGLWSIQRKVTKIGEVTDEKAQCLDDRDDLILDAISANLELGIVTGKAVRDGRCNGEMTAALAIAQQVQNKKEKFMNETANKALRHHNK